ncbi:MAG TPA: hypothetical protein VGR69_07955 [Candidatus Rubrimentiphilum sp.]|nr:hypothetical protein [Candidatus Rubrimentiphilum sp.]
MIRGFFAYAALAAAITLVGATSSKKNAMPAMQLPPGMTPAIYKMMMTPLKGHPAAMPAGTVPFGGCIPSMGYHYANPKDWPVGPIYGYYNGKAVFTEVMLDQRFFAQGKEFNGVLKPLPGYKIDHVDIWFEKHGHPGYSIPHYDVHAWYLPASQYMYFCGNKSGKKPAFL